MKQEGPYKNRWAEAMSPQIITLCDDGIYRTHLVNEDPFKGIQHPSRRDARAYLRDNGFILGKT
jgi:hypothetical protein